ncbi:MAG: phosphate signaling complex protein PhoU [Clostridiales bacterium]|nr:phosphate signaling complex protein PhoU [Clostridiales bacterium]
MTTRITFEQELRELNRSLEEMGLFVENALEKLTMAIEERDKNLAETMIKNDRYVNDMERTIESKCLSLITRQQPIARDLRMISAVLKVVTDIERVGDHVVDIAELLVRFEEADPCGISSHIPVMLVAAKEMVRDAVDAFVGKSIEDAGKVIASDDVVDDLFNRVKADVIERLRTERGNEDHCIDTMNIAKYLEKIGDHAVNIAQWEVFKETGSIDKVRLL